MIISVSDAIVALRKAWKPIVKECRQVLGSELHYQAMIYHALRTYGKVPLPQIGMNVRMYVKNPKTDLFKRWTERRAEGYQGGYEPTPDVVIFAPGIKGDWRRRRCLYGITRESSHMFVLMEMEIKASEWSKGRVTIGKVATDILKLANHRQEINLMRQRLGLKRVDIYQVVLIVDTAPEKNERMTPLAMKSARALAEKHKVHFCYISPSETIF